MKTVLVTPLDWGLGHATRCIPIIRELLTVGARVIIAGTGDSLAVLLEEFPQLKSFDIPGYQPVYARHNMMVWSMLAQLPKFSRSIAAENAAIADIVRTEGADAVVSDNRYGAWCKDVYSVIVTHQSNVMMPKRFGWAAPFVRRLITSKISRFDECWIPDFPDGRLSGGLSHHDHIGSMKGRVRYIGPVSRFSTTRLPRKYDVVVILSGPEPQRSILESILIPQCAASGLKYFVVRGLPKTADLTCSPNVANHLDSSAMERLICESQVVVCRSGYSSVMDMARLGKKAIFIPTPGQTEQEYLADKFYREGIAFSMRQKEFDLSLALKESLVYSGFTGDDGQNSRLNDAVIHLLTAALH
jgi:UDP:flavonoid glycosyltransferase YjiC (YdhE family)